MWFIPTKKEVKKEFKKISDSFKELKNQSTQNKDSIQKNKNDILELKYKLKLQEQIRELTTRSNLNISEKRILKRFDSLKLMKAIQSCINQGYTTNNIKEEITLRFNIKSTCFFKYLKLVREQQHKVTTRSKN